jgi:hypothetical protein
MVASWNCCCLSGYGVHGRNGCVTAVPGGGGCGRDPGGDAPWLRPRSRVTPRLRPRSRVAAVPGGGGAKTTERHGWA